MGEEADSDDDAEEGVNVSPSTGSIFTLIAAVIVTLVCWFIYVFFGKLQGVFAFIGGFFLMVQVFSFDFGSSSQSSSREQRDELGMTKSQKRANDQRLRDELESSRLQMDLQRETEKAESELRSAETKKVRNYTEMGELKEARELLERTTGRTTRGKKEAADAHAADKTLKQLTQAFLQQDENLKKMNSQLSKFASLQAASQNGDSKSKKS